MSKAVVLQVVSVGSEAALGPHDKYIIMLYSVQDKIAIRIMVAFEFCLSLPFISDKIHITLIEILVFEILIISGHTDTHIKEGYDISKAGGLVTTTQKELTIHNL